MSRVVATMPGRFGDILWALPTVRALAERHDQPVELYVSKKYGDESFLSLIRAQDYIEKAEAIEGWEVVETAPMTPRVPPLGVSTDEDCIFYHLGYPSWPSKPLPYDIAARVGVLVNLEKPWIEWPLTPQWLPEVVTGWSPEWKELKAGISSYVRLNTTFQISCLVPHGSPYLDVDSVSADWIRTAAEVGAATLFLGDLSAPWVLAVALGTPAVIVEPEPMRHNSIFWVDIEDEKGRRMTRMVKGNDNLPTFDWNHVADELKAAWEEFSP